MADVFDRPLGDLLGGSLVDWTGEEAAAVIRAVDQARANALVGEAVIRLRGNEEGCRWIEIRCAPLAGSRDLVASFRDVTLRHAAELALRVANSELNRLTGSDPVTDLANRRRFDQTLGIECRRASRDAMPLSLIRLDVDDVLAIGHPHGAATCDACLRQVAAVLRQMTVRPADTAARLGGEEFALLLPQTDEVAAARAAGRLRAALADVTVSIGYATVRPTLDTLASAGAALLSEADHRLHRERNSAGGRSAPGHRRMNRQAGDGHLPVRPIPGINQIARIAAKLLGVSTAFVVSLEPDGPVVAGHHGLENGAITTEWGRTMMRDGGPLVVPDAAADPELRRAAAECGFAFLAAAPLLSGLKRQETGALWVADVRPHLSWSDSEPLLLSQLASLAAETLHGRGAPDRVRLRNVA